MRPLVRRPLLAIALFLSLSCNNAGPTAPAAPPKVLPQAPTSCIYRVGQPDIDDRVGWFHYDVRWFPPEQHGSDPVTSYEVELIREAVTGTSTPQGYQIESSRNLPVVKKTERAKTGTTNDLHSIADIVSFPLCDFLSRGEDLVFRSKVRATSAAGMSLPSTCVEAEELWDGIVFYIYTARDYWNYYCGAVRMPPVGGAPSEWIEELPSH